MTTAGVSVPPRGAPAAPSGGWLTMPTSWPSEPSWRTSSRTIAVIEAIRCPSWVAVMQDAIVNWFALRGVSIEYFGAKQQLLGSLHQPQRLRARSTAVLLCNPFGEEAARAHRSYRVLAT